MYNSERCNFELNLSVIVLWRWGRAGRNSWGLYTWVLGVLQGMFLSFSLIDAFWFREREAHTIFVLTITKPLLHCCCPQFSDLRCLNYACCYEWYVRKEPMLCSPSMHVVQNDLLKFSSMVVMISCCHRYGCDFKIQVMKRTQRQPCNLNNITQQ